MFCTIIILISFLYVFIFQNILNIILGVTYNTSNKMSEVNCSEDEFDLPKEDTQQKPKVYGFYIDNSLEMVFLNKQDATSYMEAEYTEFMKQLGDKNVSLIQLISIDDFSVNVIHTTRGLIWDYKTVVEFRVVDLPLYESTEK
jgi:hypothetical protein